MQEAVATIHVTCIHGHVSRKPVIIYTLSDPADGAVRYVGITTQKLRKRIVAHMSAARRGNAGWVRNWLRQLLARNAYPEACVLEVLPPGADWQGAERKWIDHHKALGCELVNSTTGGEGASGYRLSDAAKQSIRAKRLGLKNTPETIERMRFAQRNCPGASPEILARAHAASRRETRSPETAARVKAANNGLAWIGRKHSEESKEKIRRSQAITGYHPRKGANHPNARAVILGGVRFVTTVEAAKQTGMTERMVHCRLKKGTAHYATD